MLATLTQGPVPNVGFGLLAGDHDTQVIRYKHKNSTHCTLVLAPKLARGLEVGRNL